MNRFRFGRLAVLLYMNIGLSARCPDVKVGLRKAFPAAKCCSSSLVGQNT